MAKYIVLDSKFTPMSFAERIAPYQDYYENAYKQQEEIANLELAASSLEKALEDERDTNLKSQYADYINKITALRDSINTFGVDNNIINEGLKARSAFNSNIVPIMQAQQRRQEAINNWSKDFDKKARYIGNSPLETSITDWMHGATPNIYNIKGSDVAELSKNLTLGVTTDLLDDSDVQKITQGINPNSLNNIIYSMEYDADSILTEKEKEQKQHLNNIINAVKADYDFNSLTKDQQKQFMKEVYTGILLGNVYNEELKKSGSNRNTKNGLINFSDLKTVPLHTYSLLSPNIKNREKSNKELIVETYPELEPYITNDGKLVYDQQKIIWNYLEPLVEEEFENILENKGLNKSEISPNKRSRIYATATDKVLRENRIHENENGEYFSYNWPEELEKILEQSKDLSDIEQKLNSIDIEKLKESYLANFHEVRFANPDKIAKYIIDKADTNAGEDNLSIRRVKQFKPEQSEQGTKLKWEFDEGKAVKKEDFEWDEDNDYIGSTPFFYRSLVESDNPGLVMNIGDVSYFVPSSLLGGIDQSELYLQDYNVENDVHDNALKTFEEYVKSKNYINEDGSWKEGVENDEIFNLLYEQVLTAKSAKEAAAARFTGNIADLFYTIENPTYKH